MEVAAIIVAAIERKYFSVSYFNHPYLQLNSMMKLVKLYAHSTSKINSVVIIRGFITYQGSSLDKESIKWKRCTDCRRDRSHFASVLYHGEVYAISTLSNIAAGTVEKFNPYLDQWHLVSRLPRPLHSVGAVVLQGKLYVLGGYDNSNNISDCVYEYVNDTKEGEWVECPELTLLQPRCKHAAVAFNGKIWIAGGSLQGGIEFTASVHIYDPQRKCWEIGPSMNVKRDYANLLVVNNALYVVGGDVGNDGTQKVRTIEAYNEESREWEVVTAFKVRPNSTAHNYSVSHTYSPKDHRRGFSTCAVNNSIYIFGGCSEDDYESNTCDSYDLISNKWASDSFGYRPMPKIDTWGQAVTIPKSTLNW